MRPLKDVVLPPEILLRRKISVKQAADLKNIGVDTFKRRYGHLIEKVSERRNACELGKVLDAT